MMAGEYNPVLIKSRDKNAIVEELLEKLKATGCFDSKRKQFLSEITNKSSYQTLHTKVENLSTKFLDNIRWPPSVEKHQLREQLRLHIQSTDLFNDYIEKLVDQELNCKIQSELKPLIESKACEYLEVNYDNFKNLCSDASQFYDVFESCPPTMKDSIKKEPMKMSDMMKVEPDQSHQEKLPYKPPFVMKYEDVAANQSNIVNSSSMGLKTYPSTIGLSNKPQMLSSTFLVNPSSLPPPIGLLPPPHRIPPSNLFQPIPPPPPPIFIPIVPPPPPEDNSFLPPPPPPENGPNTPTDEYIPEFQNIVPDLPTVTTKPKGLLQTPDKEFETKPSSDNKILSPKKIIWGQIVITLHEISDASDAEPDRIEKTLKFRARKPPSPTRSSASVRAESVIRPTEEVRSKDTVAKIVDKPVADRPPSPAKKPARKAESNNRPNVNDYTDVSSGSLSDNDFKDVPANPTTIPSVIKATTTAAKHCSSSHSSTKSSSSKGQTSDRNVRKTKSSSQRRKHSSSSSSSTYSSSEMSSENRGRSCRPGSSKHSPGGKTDGGNCSADPANTGAAESNRETSVEARKNQIKARLQEIDAERTLLQKQQVKKETEKQRSRSVSSGSSDSSSDGSSSEDEDDGGSTSSSEASKSSGGDQSSRRDHQSKSPSVISNQPSVETVNENSDSDQMKSSHHDSEPEEGEVSSESLSDSESPSKCESSEGSNELKPILPTENNPDVHNLDVSPDDKSPLTPVDVDNENGDNQ